MTNEQNDKMTYEQARKELIDIVLKLESSELELEKSIKLFEKGQKLAKFCEEYLTQAKQKIQR